MGVGDTIRALRKDRGLTQAGLVNAVKKHGGDLSQPQLSAIERNEVDRPGALVEIAIALGTTTEALISSGKQHEPTSGRPTKGNGLRPDDTGITVPPRAEMARTLPILGTVSGGVGGLTQMDNGNAIDYALRPTRLVGRTDVAAFWVEDLSMGEAYKPGSLVVVERKRPPQIGDDVVFELAPSSPREERRALIKRYQGRTATHYKFEQLNPRKALEYPIKQVENLMRVIPLAELLGV